MIKSARSGITLRYALLIIGFALLVAGCGGSGGGGESNSSSMAIAPPGGFSLSGQVQKGPLIFGSSVWVSELDTALKPSGKIYLAQTTDDLGNFTVGSNVGSNLIELLAEGYYMDELTGGLSTSPITLRAVADLSVYPTPIINVLTSIQVPRLKNLISTGKTYQDAMQQSQIEALAAFGIDATKITSFKSLYAMQINGTTDQDSVLLATSAILSKMATNSAMTNGSSQAAELTFYLSRIGSDLQNAGVLSNSTIIAARNLAATQIDLAAIRSNVETYYAKRGVTVVAPRFEEWVDKDGSGVLPRRLVPATGFSFTDVTGVEPNQLITSNTITVSGLGAGVAAPVTVSADTTIIKNNAAVSGIVSTAIDGDTIALRVTSLGYSLTTTPSTISIGSSSAAWKVTTKALGGTISGLTGTGLVLQNNGGDNITIPAGSTNFAFAGSIANGATYNVSVLAQPSVPLQVCTVTNGTGTVGASASTVNVSCSAAELAYVTNFSSNSVSAYAINATTGALTNIGTFATANNPVSIAADPTGKFAYVGSNNCINGNCNQNVSAYSIATTGALTSIGTVVTGINSIVIDPTGKFAYATDDPGVNVLAYSINPSSGALTSVGTFATGTNFQCHYITVDPTGRFVYVGCSYMGSLSGSVFAYSINGTTGALTSIGTFGTGFGSTAIDPTGKFAYVTDNGNGNISAYSVNATTGALTSIGAVAIHAPLAMSVDPTGKFAYVLNPSLNNNNVSAYSINVTTGALTSVGTFATGNTPWAVTVDPTGKFAYVVNVSSNDVSAYSINATTGALTSIGTFATGTQPQSIAVTRGP